MAESFDIGPFWHHLLEMAKFVRGRIRFGQTDVEAFKMATHVHKAYIELRTSVIKDEAHARQNSRLIFWQDCKGALEPIFDHAARVPRSAVTLASFYKSLYDLQMLALEKPAAFWATAEKPEGPAFPQQIAVMPRKRQRSLPLQPAKQAKGNKAGVLGEKGIWSWNNPPRILYESPGAKGFWLFSKPAFWVCSTPENIEEDFEERFSPIPGDCEGHLVVWINRKFSRQYPFLRVYKSHMQYGLLNRLDRETSGIVVVAKTEADFHRVKRLRDTHDWHKEYVCLVHGAIPVEHSEGIVQGWTETRTQGSAGRSEMVPQKTGGACKWTISHYQVLEYHKSATGNAYTLVKVRIITGARHQIRVHMRHLLKSKFGFPEHKCGLVGDFEYLERSQANLDRQRVCQRIFLHEQMLGMWDPEDNNKAVVGFEQLPTDLRNCLQKLRPDIARMQELKSHRKANADRCPVHKFCQDYKIGPAEKAELLGDRTLNEWAGGFWQRSPEFLELFLTAFRKEAGKGLPTLSFDGDHTFLFEKLRQSVEQACGGARLPPSYFQEIVEDNIKSHISNKLWWQAQESQERALEEAKDSEPLPPGWRRMKNGNLVFYLHENGMRERRRPIPDPDLLEGWLKLECQSRPGQAIYYHPRSRKTLPRPPVPEDELPPGWMRVRSKTEADKWFYLHRQTGRTQLGMPPEGPLEDLPPNWEKVASSKRGGAPYYFNRATGESSHVKPEELPPGWRKEVSKSTGRSYYYNSATGKSTFEKPVAAAAVVAASASEEEDEGMPGQLGGAEIELEDFGGEI